VKGGLPSIAASTASTAKSAIFALVATVAKQCRKDDAIRKPEEWGHRMDRLDAVTSRAGCSDAMVGECVTQCDLVDHTAPSEVLIRTAPAFMRPKFSLTDETAILRHSAAREG